MQCNPADFRRAHRAASLRQRAQPPARHQLRRTPRDRCRAQASLRIRCRDTKMFESVADTEPIQVTFDPVGHRARHDREPKPERVGLVEPILDARSELFERHELSIRAAAARASPPRRPAGWPPRASARPGRAHGACRSRRSRSRRSAARSHAARNSSCHPTNTGISVSRISPSKSNTTASITALDRVDGAVQPNAAVGGEDLTGNRDRAHGDDGLGDFAGGTNAAERRMCADPLPITAQPSVTANIGVAVVPGATALTGIPSGPSSRAADRTSCARPAFDAA